MPLYITIDLDQCPQLIVTVSKALFDLSLGKKFENTFESLDRRWAMKQAGILKKFAAAGQWQCYVGAHMDIRSLSSEIDGLTAMRDEHCFNPHDI